MLNVHPKFGVKRCREERYKGISKKKKEGESERCNWMVKEVRDRKKNEVEKVEEKVASECMNIIALYNNILLVLIYSSIWLNVSVCSVEQSHHSHVWSQQIQSDFELVHFSRRDFPQSY